MFYLIDKPAGISSFTVIRKIRKILGIKKMGHSGTLDPFATGCLIIATDNSTKLIPLLESSEKEYVVDIRFDGKTESYDTETSIEISDLTHFSWRSNKEIIDFLLSQKRQIPPKYSAIHIDGKRSYELARKGAHFTLKERSINVLEAEILHRGSYEIRIRMIVSSGCYMRSFGPLLGNFLGTDGGYLSALKRTKILGKYAEIKISDCSSIDNMKTTPLSNIFHTIHTFKFCDELISDISKGKVLSSNTLPPYIKNDEKIFISNVGGTFLSLCRKDKDFIKIIKNNVL